MRRSVVILIMILAFGLEGMTQQDKMFTQYLNYPSSLNPAYVGSRKALQFMGVGRTQWLGIEGAPESAVFSVNSPINFYNLGIGVTFETDKLGPESNTDFGLDISYQFKVAKKTYLNLGVKSGLSYYFVDLKNSRATDAGDPWLQQDVRGEWIPNFGVGAYLHGERFFAGLSVPRLLRTDIENGRLLNSTIQRNNLHYYLMAGYVMDFSPFVKFKPTALAKATNGAPLSYDLSLTFIIFDRLWLGTSYRNEDAMAAILQFNINNQLKIGYSYDFGIAQLSGRSLGSHEISLSYDIAFELKKLKSPRYF